MNTRPQTPPPTPHKKKHKIATGEECCETCDFFKEAARSANGRVYGFCKRKTNPDADPLDEEVCSEWVCSKYEIRKKHH